MPHLTFGTDTLRVIHDPLRQGGDSAAQVARNNQKDAVVLWLETVRAAIQSPQHVITNLC